MYKLQNNNGAYYYVYIKFSGDKILYSNVVQETQGYHLIIGCAIRYPKIGNLH